MYRNLIITIIIVFLVNHTSPTPEVAVDMKRCVAYEVTTLAKQKVVMETNPAYEMLLFMPMISRSSVQYGVLKTMIDYRRTSTI